MNRRWIITLTLIPAIVVVVALVVYGLHTVPSSQCSALYRHYENNPHLSVTYIKDFPIDDTLTVDVTTLRALDNEGWDTLSVAFNVLEPPEVIQKEIDAGKDIVSVGLTPKTAPGQPMDTTDLLKNNVIGISRKSHTISIFNTDTEEQQNAVANYNFRKGY
ncbi:MAG: hypothetical protein II849_03455 [Bacteroidales bacterium]|nr:hypothetical protein [Bacteroidales bacterium]